MARKKFMTVILLIVAANIAVLAIALRNPSNLLRDDTTINLSNSEIFHVSETINTNKSLVPLGEFKGPDDMDQYIYDYQVTLNKMGLLKVSVDPSSIKIGDGLHDFNDLVVIQIYHEENIFLENPSMSFITPFTQWDDELNAYTLNIKIRVFIRAPQHSDDYESAYEVLAGNSITFSILFEKLEANE